MASAPPSHGEGSQEARDAVDRRAHRRAAQRGKAPDLAHQRHPAGHVRRREDEGNRGLDRRLVERLRHKRCHGREHYQYKWVANIFENKERQQHGDQRRVHAHHDAALARAVRQHPSHGRQQRVGHKAACDRQAKARARPRYIQQIER